MTKMAVKKTGIVYIYIYIYIICIDQSYNINVFEEFKCMLQKCDKKLVTYMVVDRTIYIKGSFKNLNSQFI